MLGTVSTFRYMCLLNSQKNPKLRRFFYPFPMDEETKCQRSDLFKDTVK